MAFSRWLWILNQVIKSKLKRPMKPKSEYAEDNGMKRGSCWHAMLIWPPPSTSNQPKKPSKQENSSGCTVLKEVELNISFSMLWIPLCRELSASHSSFMQNFTPGPWLLSLSSDGSAESPVPGSAVSLTAIFSCSFPIVSDYDKCFFTTLPWNKAKKYCKVT